MANIKLYTFLFMKLRAVKLTIRVSGAKLLGRILSLLVADNECADNFIPS
jgi:hypothetical protein